MNGETIDRMMMVISIDGRGVAVMMVMVRMMVLATWW